MSNSCYFLHAFREDNAYQAFMKFNARWYGGKQLSAQFVNVASWKRAICGNFSFLIQRMLHVLFVSVYKQNCLDLCQRDIFDRLLYM